MNMMHPYHAQFPNNYMNSVTCSHQQPKNPPIQNIPTVMTTRLSRILSIPLAHIIQLVVYT